MILALNYCNRDSFAIAVESQILAILSFAALFDRLKALSLSKMDNSQVSLLSIPRSISLAIPSVMILYRLVTPPTFLRP